MTKSIESKILIKSKKCGRGSVFFVGDFISYGNRDAVNKALERLVERGQMLRVARGIYCYPKMEKVYGLGMVPPSLGKKGWRKNCPNGTLCPIPVRTDSTDTDEPSLLNRWRLTYYKSWRREKHKIQARLSQIFLHP